MSYPCPQCGKPMVKSGNATSGNARWMCRGPRPDRQYCYSTTNPESKAVIRQDGSKKRRKPLTFRLAKSTAKRYLITAAQNGTPVHEGFLAALKLYAANNDAQLIVIPIRYKNPTSRWDASQKNEEVWDDKVMPYLCNTRLRLGKNLVILGDVKTQPTAVSPLSGFESITHGESGILGHTKLQLKTIPTPQSRFPKILTTTGAVTVPNYTDSKAGKLGEFHHTLGAALVELDGKLFHLRQINADKQYGSFTDLDKAYGDFGVANDLTVAALDMGDTHVDFIDPDVERATFGKGGVVDTLKPKFLIWHDVCDDYSVNPHHKGNPFIGIAKAQSGKRDARAETERAIAFIRERTPEGVTSIIVPSNHNDFLTRWIISRDWRDDPDNAAFYLETASHMVTGTKMTSAGTEYPSAFEYWVKRLTADIADRVLVLERDESFMVRGIEVGMHGHQGPHGSRGSLQNLRRIGVKFIIGHSHSPGIDEGGMQVGTSTRLRLEYNSGPSGWLNTHAVIYANGKRSLINIIKGEWRL